MKYQHLFFDLDRTLWDFERNSSEAIEELFIKFDLGKILHVDSKAFILTYKEINHQVWAEYRNELITKDQLRLKRYFEAFKYYGLEDKDFSLLFNDEYIKTCSVKPHLIPDTKTVLDYLQPKYELHIITNGFVEAQYVKLEKSGLAPYFSQVVVSDGLGYRKPDKRIFHHAMKVANAKAENSLMIGDDYEPDVMGAKSVGMDQVFYNFSGKVKEATYNIKGLIELKDFL